MIQFKILRYKNLLSSSNQFTEIQLDRSPTTLIVGKNGSGKSQMIDALTFALYNKAFRKINLSDLVNKVNKKGTVVELEFCIGAVEYKIVRTLKPNSFKIYIDGELKKQEAALKDYQKFLENSILKMSEKTFRQIVVLGSTSFVPFMRLCTGDRRLVIEDLLDIQLFSLMNNIIKVRASTINDNYKELHSDIKLIDNSIDLKERHLREMKNRSDADIETNIGKINKLNNHQDRIKNVIKIHEVDKKQIMRGLDREAMIIDSNKNERLKQIKTVVNNNKFKLINNIKFFYDNDNCPTCRQDINEDFKSDHISSLNEKKTEYEEGLVKLELEVSNLEHRLDIFAEGHALINDLDRKIQLQEHNIGAIENNIRLLEEQIEESQNKKDDTDESGLDHLRNQYKEMNGKKDIYVSDLYNYSVISELLKDDGIKSHIIKTYLPIINKLIRKYLDVLEFNIEFQFDENFDEKIKARNRDEYSYSNFSEGEKMRIDLCMLFTWRELSRIRNSAATNLLIFDEIGDSSLDDKGFDSFMKIINESAKGQNVFIISHKGDIMADKFRNIITFENKSGFSQMST